MNLYHISQSTNNDYDTYDSAVVAAENEKQARHTLPGNSASGNYDTWIKPSLVSVRFIGTATEGTPAGVICASFNAG